MRLRDCVTRRAASISPCTPIAAFRNTSVVARPQLIQDTWPDFFDPEVMRRYRPEYISLNEYQKRIKQNKAREALIQAAASSMQLGAMENSRREFMKADEAEFSRQLSNAQQAAAALEPKINALYQILQQGEADRERKRCSDGKRATIWRWAACWP